jgi:hypothetical protein
MGNLSKQISVEDQRAKNYYENSGWSTPRGYGTGNVRCFNCDRVGHFARYCQEKRWHPSSQRKWRNFDEKAQVNSVKADIKPTAAIEKAIVQVDDVRIGFEVDTGSKYSVICSGVYQENFAYRKLKASGLQLSVVSGEQLRVLGTIKVDVQLKRSRHVLELIVIDTKKRFLPLLGRDWLNVLCPKWREAFRINKVVALQGDKTELLRKKVEQLRSKIVKDYKRDFAELFDNDLSKPIQGITVDIRMKPGVKGFVHKPYTVPFSMREKFEKELDALESSDIIERVEYVEWASPMVGVKKPNGEVRPCLDGSKTINPHILTNHYPVPVIEDMLVNKSDAKYFTVLDLKGAYTQLCVSEDTKRMLGINTIKGLYVYKRLPFACEYKLIVKHE